MCPGITSPAHSMPEQPTLARERGKNERQGFLTDEAAVQSATKGGAACREGLYAGGYLGLFPVIRAALEERGTSPVASLALAGIAGGTFGAVASHPFDTAKTRMQVCAAGTGIRVGRFPAFQSALPTFMNGGACYPKDEECAN